MRKRYNTKMGECPGHWRVVGQLYRMVRQALNLTAAQVAKDIAVSVDTMRKFESGDPIQRAELIKKAYGMCLRLHVMEGSFCYDDWKMYEAKVNLNSVLNGCEYECNALKSVSSDIAEECWWIIEDKLAACDAMRQVVNLIDS